MTSKVVPTAPRDLKAIIASDDAGKEDVKASATSATDEPTNSSTLGSLNTTNKKEKPVKAPGDAQKPQGEAQLELVGDLSHAGDTKPSDQLP